MFDRSGNELWASHIDQDMGSTHTKTVIEASSNTDLIFCGYDASLYMTDTRPFVLRLDSAGNLLWAKAYNIGPPGTASYIKDCV